MDARKRFNPDDLKNLEKTNTVSLTSFWSSTTATTPDPVPHYEPFHHSPTILNAPDHPITLTLSQQTGKTLTARTFSSTRTKRACSTTTP